METAKETELSEEKIAADIRKFTDIMNISRKCMQIELNKIGLSIGQPMVLYTIKNFSDFNQKEVAKICQVKPSTLSRSLDSLEKNGLIERHFNLDKRRTISLTLTPLGEEKLIESSKCLSKIYNAILGDISEEEVQSVKLIFAKVRGKLEAYYYSIST